MDTTKEGCARALNGREYRNEITPELEGAASKCGLVVIFGASDDLIEIRGVFSDEVGCYGGGEFLIDWEGLLPLRSDIDEDEELERFFQRRRNAAKIKAIWAQDGISWQYETAIPHARFDIMEGNEVYCRGIVLERALLPVTSVPTP